MDSNVRLVLDNLLHVAQMLERVYWDEVKESRTPSHRYREALKRLRTRIYKLQKSLGVIE